MKKGATSIFRTITRKISESCYYSLSLGTQVCPTRPWGLFSTSEVERTPTGDVARHDLSEGAAQCAFTLAAVPTEQEAGAVDVVAQGIVAALSKDTFNDVQWLDLPCGPAVSCVTWREYQLGPEVTATAEPADFVTAEMQIHVPFPTGPFTAVFTLVTASIDHWSQSST